MKGRNWSPVGSRRRGLTTSFSRLAFRFVAVASAVATIHFMGLYFQYRSSMREKYSPTQFNAISNWEPESDAGNAERGVLLDNRKHWKKLGEGREGEAFTFNGSVIKVYNDASSPFRNCISDADGVVGRWPTEIPATLIMGGHEGDSALTNDGAYRDTFVPVKDYFLAATDPSQPPKWHLVTPFYQSGTLKKLAKRLRSSKNPPSYREVDQMFRPSFEAVLSALGYLHEAQNLCHDDVKLDNIFVASGEDPTQWKIGDLGNAREPEHGYHSSPLWTADTPQLRDCRANDALRLVKAYMQFLRLSSADPDAFDAALFGGVETVSRMYWSVRRAAVPMSAADVGEVSAMYPPRTQGDEELWLATEPAEVEVSRGWAPAAEAVLGWRGALARVVRLELRVGAKEDLGKFFGMTGIFGIPVGACQAL
ncbi:hypothetical protein CCHL11_02149 [Colletotrichum chlorophyti]|uniref:Protein kinase domain-containing protein n=1 Tax=Colletotrichum chlorophyti TaxID=708187 RepID=A0A1Q8S6N6_9PEZI|nr:hypothetical protein CCHL11_02149 [Colletotrichum chlorophyti]